jgi:hypothetical protein
MEETTDFKVFDETEEQGQKNILKYFDRIHDKLFSFNNIMIAGFFALSKFENPISIKNILIPFINLGIILYIEYRMMELSRTESIMKSIPINELPKKLYNKYGIITKISLVSIISTLIVTLIFLYYLLFK